ncbi:uncharacterized protein DFE_2849 [Desulfovibrio ferrophilus]|uniref:Uncharacterized protein n=1 Tax=Desulfovibrio ferrophilus TaxID=241368 RepID=A0A2Z6B265_9BACT|nr:uncharacterized protein DFE_2849 [Desulfovibrio ferrophilus]
MPGCWLIWQCISDVGKDDIVCRDAWDGLLDDWNVEAKVGHAESGGCKVEP